MFVLRDLFQPPTRLEVPSNVPAFVYQEVTPPSWKWQADTLSGLAAAAPSVVWPKASELFHVGLLNSKQLAESWLMGCPGFVELVSFRAGRSLWISTATMSHPMSGTQSRLDHFVRDMHLTTLMYLKHVILKDALDQHRISEAMSSLCLNVKQLLHLPKWWEPSVLRSVEQLDVPDFVQSLDSAAQVPSLQIWEAPEGRWQSLADWRASAPVCKWFSELKWEGDPKPMNLSYMARLKQISRVTGIADKLCVLLHSVRNQCCSDGTGLNVAFTLVTPNNVFISENEGQLRLKPLLNGCFVGLNQSFAEEVSVPHLPPFLVKWIGVTPIGCFPWQFWSAYYAWQLGLLLWFLVFGRSPDWMATWGCCFQEMAECFEKRPEMDRVPAEQKLLSGSTQGAAMGARSGAAGQETKEEKEEKGIQKSTAAQEGKTMEEGKERRETKETKEKREAKEAKEGKERKETKEGKEGKEGKEAKEGKKSKEAKKGREGKESKAAAERQESKEAKETPEAQARQERKKKKSKQPTLSPEELQEEAIRHRQRQQFRRLLERQVESVLDLYHSFWEDGETQGLFYRTLSTTGRSIVVHWQHPLASLLQRTVNLLYAPPEEYVSYPWKTHDAFEQISYNWLQTAVPLPTMLDFEMTLKASSALLSDQPAPFEKALIQELQTVTPPAAVPTPVTTTAATQGAPLLKVVVPEAGNPAIQAALAHLPSMLTWLTDHAELLPPRWVRDSKSFDSLSLVQLLSTALCFLVQKTERLSSASLPVVTPAQALYAAGLIHLHNRNAFTDGQWIRRLRQGFADKRALLVKSIDVLIQGPSVGWFPTWSEGHFAPRVKQLLGPVISAKLEGVLQRIAAQDPVGIYLYPTSATAPDFMYWANLNRKMTYWVPLLHSLCTRTRPRAFTVCLGLDLDKEAEQTKERFVLFQRNWERLGLPGVRVVAEKPPAWKTKILAADAANRLWFFSASFRKELLKSTAGSPAFWVVDFDAHHWALFRELLSGGEAVTTSQAGPPE